MDSLRHYIDALPQEPPAVFVDDLELVEHRVQVVGSVTFLEGHRVFDGHLPGRPLVPGVILIEALAQLSGIVMIPPGGDTATGFLAEVRAMRFRRLVHPGERVVLRSSLVRELGSAASFDVSAEVGDAVSVEGSLVLGGMT